jgi:hypothetical protein
VAYLSNYLDLSFLSSNKPCSYFVRYLSILKNLGVVVIGTFAEGGSVGD